MASSHMNRICFENACPGHSVGPPGLLITQLMHTILTAQCSLGNTNDYPRDFGDDLKDNEVFDFIVVGAGSSGSPVASRLAENPNWRILLLEAGGDPSFISDIPAFLFSTQGSDIDWKFFSEKNNFSCLGMINEKCSYPRGKVLGGCSTINAMLYVRGNAKDYEEWEAVGNEGWSYENVLKYFKRSENLNGYTLIDDETYTKSVRMDSSRGKIFSKKYHSDIGPLSVSSFANGGMDDIKSAIFGGVRELNLSALEDINGKNQIGFTNVPGTLFKGTRGNTAKMYLNPKKNNPNLFVVKNATVRKLIIKNGEVEGVEFIRNNEFRTVRVKNEVILSAGAIGSPHLLMLSGVGPAAHLEAVGISPLLDLKGVGENLQDHYLFIGFLFSILKSQPPSLPPNAALDSMYHFLTKSEGPFSSIGLTDLIGFVDTKYGGNVPDIQYHFINFLKNDSFILPEVMRIMHLKDDLKNQYFDAVKETGALLMCPTLLKPKGRGRIELRTSDANDPPKIFAELLKEPEDRETLLRGIRFLMKLGSTKTFQFLEPELIRFKIPECDMYPFEGDEFWLCLMKYMTTSLYHPVGTCKMGPKWDPNAVVDNRLRVHGIKNLRVADASIMPTIIRGNTNAAAIMIGEKCADMIKEDWKYHQHYEL